MDRKWCSKAGYSCKWRCKGSPLGEQLWRGQVGGGANNQSLKIGGSPD